MKYLKKQLLTGLAFIFALTAALGWDVSRLAEAPIFREVPGTRGIMEDITTMCTLITPNLLCSLLYASEHEIYWYDAVKTQPMGGIPTHSVFLGGDEWY